MICIFFDWDKVYLKILIKIIGVYFWFFLEFWKWNENNFMLSIWVYFVLIYLWSVCVKFSVKDKVLGVLYM